MLYTKHYTLAEAKHTLEEIKPKLEELVSLKKLMDEKGYDVFKHQYFGGMGPNGQKAFPLQLERLVEIVREFGERQIEVKDLSRGLIDFPHLRNNSEEVYLCYLLGEASILSWHTITGGFAGRRSLEEL